MDSPDGKVNVCRLAVVTGNDQTVFLHLADLDCVQSSAGSLVREKTLPEEHARADRFIKPEHGQRFLASRYFLRTVLSSYTDEDPEHIRIAYTEREKPFLSKHSLPFNLSHSGGFAVVGVSRTGDLGVDMETRSNLETAIQVSPRIMTSGEHGLWAALPESVKMNTFLKYWTLKEAILKAHGDGLLQDPRGIELDLTRAAPRISRLADPFGGINGWQLGLVNPPSPWPRVAWALRS